MVIPIHEGKRNARAVNKGYCSFETGKMVRFGVVATIRHVGQRMKTIMGV